MQCRQAGVRVLRTTAPGVPSPPTTPSLCLKCYREEKDRREQEKRLDEFRETNPLSYHYLHEHKGALPRPAQYDTVVNWKGWSEDGDRISLGLVLVGDSFTGKTTACYHLAHKLVESGDYCSFFGRKFRPSEHDPCRRCSIGPSASSWNVCRRRNSCSSTTSTRCGSPRVWPPTLDALRGAPPRAPPAGLHHAQPTDPDAGFPGRLPRSGDRTPKVLRAAIESGRTTRAAGRRRTGTKCHENRHRTSRNGGGRTRTVPASPIVQ